MLTTTTKDILDELRPLPVTKRGGAQTKFHPYKLDFVLHQLLTTEDEVRVVKQALVAYYRDADGIDTRELRTTLMQILNAQGGTQAAQA